MTDTPNVVVVQTDQMRAEAMGCTGNDQVETPTMDGMAEEGALCSRAYTPHPVCSPARGSLQTGRYSHSHGVVGNKTRLPTDVPSLAGCLREAGYRTGYVGLWHLDGETPRYVPPGPRRQGYEYWRGFNSGVEHHRGHPHPNPDGSVDWEDGYQAAVQTDLALEFIDDHRRVDGDRPFFLYLSWCPPHTPFDAPAEYAELYDPDDLDFRENVPADHRTADLRADLAEYYALVTSIDDQLGRLLDGLERWNLAEDTVVVFTADHGEMLGSHGRYRKGYPFEESVHVPLLVRYPRRIPARRTVDAVLNTVDLVPTLLSFCDASIPEGVDGEDRTALLVGDHGADCPDDTVIEGLLPFDSEWRAVRTERYLLVVDRALQVRYLFDTAEDPYQTENRAGEAAYADVEADLYDRLVEWVHETDDRQFLAREHATRFRSVQEAEDPPGALMDPVEGVFDGR